MFWGLTPALDLQEELRHIEKNGSEKNDLNILLVGGADCRHVLKTIAKIYRHKKVDINFFIVEACMETVAKQLLLLNIALQPGEAIGLDQKTKIFMELYGNTLIRPSVAKYLTNAATDLIKMITNYDYMEEKMEGVTLDVRYKERDYLENLVKFWCSKDEFNITDCWDRRLRKNLGVRYDSKLGAFDWDLHMRMHNVGGSQVCNQEYRNFRLNGIAFSWLESEVSKPNRSLVCAIIPNGENFAHYGYLGDMETGPFTTFGLDCEDKEFLKSTNGHNSFRSTDVTERNLKQIFYEIEFQKEYQHTKTNDLQLGHAVIKQERLVVDIKALENKPKLIQKCIKLKDITINFVSINVLQTMKHKQKYENLFDIIYFGNNYLKHLDQETIKKISKNQSLLIIENQLFVLSNRQKELEEYANKIQEKLKELDLETLDFNSASSNNFKFLIKK